MSKSFILAHRHKPELAYTLGVDDLFLEILESTYIDVSEVSQEDFETFLGTLSILHPEITVKRRIVSTYVLRYE